ncbi:hypothetical protein WSM22_24010 [Cytophagales bacterium WSM2-2]|nr:hypothetical protein WSM22_24010 [Cytophagales bacterium WSM2-2]
MEMKKLADFIRAGNLDTLALELINNPSLAVQKTEQGISLLQLAVYCRSEKVIEYLRPFYTELNVFEAASLGELPTVELKIKKDSRLLNTFAPDGFTALGLACFFDQYEVADFLLREGADPNIASNNSFKVAPIHSSCAISSLALTGLLLRYGANVNARQTLEVSPLHEAAHLGKNDLTQLLINNGADVNARTEAGQTPLTMALEKNFVETANLLRRYGAI